MKIFRFLFAAAILCFAFNTYVFACSCMPRPTVLDAFDASELVVATRLVGVEKVREKSKTNEYDIGYITSVTMIVTKVYKGDVKVGDELKFAQGGGADCVWTFDEEEVGLEFLFYLAEPSKGHPVFGDEDPRADAGPMYYASTCGRSNSLKGAVDDLAYLDKIDKVLGKTRLSGRFGTWYDYGFDREGIKLTIIGKEKTFTAKTDKNGFFEVYDLPPGEYIVRVDVPFGWKIDDYMVCQTSTGYDQFDPRGELTSKAEVPVKIEKNSHSALDLFFAIDTTIKGKVLSPLGKPMKGVCVKAVSTKSDIQKGLGPSDCSDENGEFAIEEIAPGNYILVANEDGKRDSEEPFGRLYFPGVNDAANAAVILVEAGKPVSGQVLQIPRTDELIKIEGVLVYSDDTPVKNEYVEFSPDDATAFDESGVRTDNNGKFVMSIVKGSTGKIAAKLSVYSSRFKNCPAATKLFKERNSEWVSLYTEPVVITATQPEQIRLKFDFPYCEEDDD